jgi:hypothetical protein
MTPECAPGTFLRGDLPILPGLWKKEQGVRVRGRQRPVGINFIIPCSYRSYGRKGLFDQRYGI